MIQSDKLAHSLENETIKQFWGKVKKLRPNTSKLPSAVDGVHANKDISELFKGKFDVLFNCVDFDKNDMNVLNADINKAVNMEPLSDYNTLLISPEYVRKGIGNLKRGKHDVSLPLTSENLI